MADLNTEEDELRADKFILVYGIHGLSRDVLELFFENTKRSGGGQIESIEIDEEGDEALINFCDPGVADRVVQKGPTFVVQARTLTVQRPPKPDPRSIFVQGIPKMVSEDFLELFFESRKRSSGGDIELIKYEAGSGEAIITFVEAEVAQRVLSRKDLVLNGSQLRISSVTHKQLKTEASGGTSDEPSTNHDPRVIHISGIPARIGKDTLELLLESKQYAVGGELESVVVDDRNGTAVVTYKHKEDAAKLLEKGALTFGGTRLTLSSSEDTHGWSPPRTGQASNKRHDECSRADLNGGVTVRVENIRNISTNQLKLALEEQTRAKVDIVTVDPESATATVKFTRCADVSEILQKKFITIEGTDCLLVPLFTKVHDRSPGSLAVVVSGLNADIDKWQLDMFFSNRRKSGGFGVRSVLMKEQEGKAIVTFHSADAVRDVVGMAKTQGHHLKKAKLIVEKMEPMPPPPLVPEPTELNRLIMLGAPPVSEEELETFLCAKPDENEQDAETTIHIMGLLYGWGKKALFVEFSTKPDYELMLTICTTMPLKDRMVTIEKVPVPTMIQVRSAQLLEREDLELYFENERSGGGVIKADIEMFDDDKCAVIDFGDNNVVKAVLCKEHRLEGQKLSVDAFYPAFGICPYGYDPTKPWSVVPEPFEYRIRNPDLWKFLTFLPSAWELLDSVGAHFGFRVSREQSSESELYVCYRMADDRDGGEGDGDSAPDEKTWRQKCTDELDHFSAAVASERIDVLSRFLREVVDEARRFISGTDGLLLNVDDAQSSITLTGWKPTVRSVCEKLRPHIRDIQDELIHREESVSEEIDLKPNVVTLLKAVHYHKQLAEQFPKLKVKVTSHGLHFEGLRDEINSAKLRVFEDVVQKVVSAVCPCSPAKLKLLQKKKVSSFIMSEFQKAKITVFLETDNTELALHALTEQELQLGQDIIQKTLVEQDIKLDTESLPVLDQPEWSGVKMTLEKNSEDDFLIVEDTQNQRIQLVSRSDICDILLEEIQNFLVNNTITEKDFSVVPPVVELLESYYPEKIQEIENNFVAYMVKIDKRETGFVVRGTKQVLPQAMLALQNVCKQVVSRDHNVSRPGMKAFLHGERGKMLISHIQTVNKVICVEVQDIQAVSGDQQIYDPEKAPVPLYTGQLPGGTLIKVLVGDLTKHQVDVIVNAANGRLDHAGGLARAIVNAGGDVIRKECSKHMQHRTELLPGEVFTSSSGQLPCKIVIHAVGPKWKGGDQDERNELFEAVVASLEEASRRGMRSVALPVISSGAFQFPLDEATNEIVEAVAYYFKENSSSCVAEVHLVDNSEQGGRSFVDAIEKQLASDEEHSVSRQSQPELMNNEEARSSSAHTPSAVVTNPDTITTKEGLSITIKRCSLADEQVDVIVNTTQSNLHLNGGGVSSVLLSAAGSVIQQEVNQNKPSSLKPGDIVATSAGNLRAKQIFHGFCVDYDEVTAVKNLEAFVLNALQQASKDMFTSIAFPAIGTGNLKYPRDMVARVMVETIMSFSKNNPNTSLKDIRLVLLPTDKETVKAFEDHWKMLSSKLGTHSRIRKLKSGKKDGGLQFKVQKDKSDKFVGQIGEAMRITLKTDDITKERTDVIMNSTDARFNTGAVSKAILQAGGAEIKRECDEIIRKQGNLKKAVMTNAGTLSCKKILHVNAVAVDTDWEDLLFTALDLVETSRLTSIALPALGTGTLQIPGHEMSEIILKTIIAFIVNRKPRHVKHISIVLPDRRLFKSFRQHILDIFKVKSSSFLSKAVDWLSHWLKGNKNDSAEQTVTYRIYALENANIDKVIDAIDQLCREEIDKYVFNDVEEQPLIANLKAEEKAEILALQKRHQVLITIESSGPCQILVEGLSANITPCVAEISKILNRIEKEQDEEKTKVELFSKVRWEFHDGTTYYPYSPEINYLIENAYLKKEKEVKWEEEIGSVVLFIDQMKERQNDDPSTDVPVQRREITPTEFAANE